MKYDFYCLRGGNLYGANRWYEKEKLNWVDNKTNASEFKSIVSERNGSFYHYDAMVLLNRINIYRLLAGFKGRALLY